MWTWSVQGYCMQIDPIIWLVKHWKPGQFTKPGRFCLHTPSYKPGTRASDRVGFCDTSVIISSHSP